MSAQSIVLPTSSVDPTTDATGTQIYAKSGGLFVKSPGGAVAQVSTGTASTPSLTTPTSTNLNFNTNQTTINANLSSVATKDWLAFVGGWGSVSVFYGLGINNNQSNANGLHHKRSSSRLRNGLYFLGNYTGGAIASGGFSVTSNAADDSTSSALNMTAASVEMAGNASGYGIGIDVPMMANETGTVKVAIAHASFGLQIDASFGDGSVSPVALTVANFDTGGGTRSISLVQVPFTNGPNGGNRLNVRVVSGGVQGPNTANLWPIYIYW